MTKSPDAFRTISEVSEDLGVPQHVLRFWETKFPAIKPLKRGGNRRYYRPEDLALLQSINRLLYSDGYTIKGVQKLLAERGAKGLIGDAPTPSSPPQAVGSPAASSGADERLAEWRAIRELLATALAA